MVASGAQIQHRNFEHAVDEASEAHGFAARDFEKTARCLCIEVLLDEGFEIPPNRRERRAQLVSDCREKSKSLAFTIPALERTFHRRR